MTSTSIALWRGLDPLSLLFLSVIVAKANPVTANPTTAIMDQVTDVTATYPPTSSTVSSSMAATTVQTLLTGTVESSKSTCCAFDQ